MRILMLGWEFPPFIAGGLGTACYGLTKALDRLGHQITFVLPRAVDRSLASHIRLVGPGATPQNGSGSRIVAPAGSAGQKENGPEPAAAIGPVGAYTTGEFQRVVFRPVPAGFSNPYGAAPVGEGGSAAGAAVAGAATTSDPGTERFEPFLAASSLPASGGPAYAGDMVVEAERYARLVVSLCHAERFDVIHAHDWMTFPAGVALSRVTGVPLVAHVHSTEFDRCGEHSDARVREIERRGMAAAERIIAVSELTKAVCVSRYNADSAKVEVVYNGIDPNAVEPSTGVRVRGNDRVVLFLGRITMQKGPEYFIRAARRVLEKVPEAKFVVAGAGDMAVRMIEEAAAIGIGHRVLFTGFLRGPQVDRIFRMADCYVMPSVSEPFGIAPLEALRADVPVIISRQSGVSEVLSNALKVDFWDVDEIANKIVAVLRHSPLRETLREQAAPELRKLTWETAAERCVGVYRAVVDAAPLSTSVN